MSGGLARIALLSRSPRRLWQSHSNGTFGPGARRFFSGSTRRLPMPWCDLSVRKCTSNSRRASGRDCSPTRTSRSRHSSLRVNFPISSNIPLRTSIHEQAFRSARQYWVYHALAPGFSELSAERTKEQIDCIASKAPRQLQWRQLTASLEFERTCGCTFPWAHRI